jgi:flagellar hook protein FlgE
MSTAFSIALSALQAQSEAINATGHNLANVNTLGFKGSSVGFRDLVTEAIGSSSGIQEGMGVANARTNQLFTQGALQGSNSPYAVAIQGNGFFVLHGSNSVLYTRDGDFNISGTGALETQTGETVQGWMATMNGIDTTTAAGDIVLPTGQVSPPTPTTKFSFGANLNASGVVGATSGSYSVPVSVIDSLGSTHNLSVDFTKTGTSSWSYVVTIPGADLAAGTPGTPYQLASGNLVFKTDGTLDQTNTSPLSVSLGVSNLVDGAANLSIGWDLVNPDGTGSLTQYSQASSYNSPQQDGSLSAQLTSVSIENGGQITASFSNGQQRIVAQIALASIQNPNSLQDVGNNNFQPTGNTATPAIGVPNTGGRGQILGKQLESSNVDMATEFTNLIIYQRGYQVSSRVITTADQMTQDLMNLIH